MNSIAAIEVPESCKSLVGLVKRQQKICKRNIETMESVRYGALIAIEECQHQFRNRRWNCSTVDPVKLFGNVLKLGKSKPMYITKTCPCNIQRFFFKAKIENFIGMEKF